MKSHDRIAQAKSNNCTAHGFLCLLFLAAFLPVANVYGAKGAIQIRADNRIALPSIVVSASPQTIYSELLTLDLSVKNINDGWMLTGAVQNDALVGGRSNVSIQASLSFKSITWISGGNGSAAGITILPDGSRIEADPSFGIGNYQIRYEIRYDAPAFPIADNYRGVSTFTIQ